MDLNYVAGFFDGEGSFVVSLKPDKRYVNGVQIDTHINITQKNQEVLKLIQQEFQMGKIYFHSRDKLWHFNIYKLNDKLKFVEMLKNRLFVKQGQLKKFSAVLQMLRQKEHLTKEGLNKLKMTLSAPETELNTS